MKLVICAYIFLLSRLSQGNVKNSIKSFKKELFIILIVIFNKSTSYVQVYVDFLNASESKFT